MTESQNEKNGPSANDYDGHPDENSEQHDQYEELDEEFSLDKLSKAYADVIRQRQHEQGQSSPNSASQSLSTQTTSTHPQNPPHPTTPNETQDNRRPSQAARQQTSNRASSTTSALTDDNSGCPIEPSTIVESIVFVGAPRGTELTLAGIAKALRDVSPADVRQISTELNTQYQQEECAWRIKVDGETDDAVVKMVLADSLDEFQRQYFGRNKEVQLNQSTIDVLAVVAYHQPVTKVEVETTRGRPCGSVLAQLVRRDLLQIEVTNEKPAKRLYRTTDRFLKFFQLTDVNDLPQSHDISEFDEYID